MTPPQCFKSKYGFWIWIRRQLCNLLQYRNSGSWSDRTLAHIYLSIITTLVIVWFRKVTASCLTIISLEDWHCKYPIAISSETLFCRRESARWQFLLPIVWRFRYIWMLFRPCTETWRKASRKSLYQTLWGWHDFPHESDCSRFHPSPANFYCTSQFSVADNMSVPWYSLVPQLNRNRPKEWHIQFHWEYVPQG